MKHLVTVCVPVYNHASYVHECIMSIINQDYLDIELIVIDDGSKDNSADIVQGLVDACKQRFVRFEFRVRSNKGLTATLNEAIDWAEGKYFSGIASDDLMLPAKTSTLVNEIELDEQAGACFGGCVTIDDMGNVFGKNTPPNRKKYNFRSVLTRDANICAPCQLLKTSVLKEVGGYPVNLYIEDYWMWLAITHLGYDIKIIPVNLVCYRIHDKNSHGNLDLMNKSFKHTLDTYSDHVYFSEAISAITQREAVHAARRGDIFFLKNFFYSVVKHPGSLLGVRFYKLFALSLLYFSLSFFK